jgi:hypothetical protein
MSALLKLSLGLNFLLAALGIYGMANWSAVSKRASRPSGPMAVSLRIAESGRQAGQIGFNWAQLESEDYPTYIANLRSVGCPEETIRDIVLAEINKLYSKKFGERSASDRKVTYWESPRRAPADTRDWQRKLTEEKNAVIKELLGIDQLAENRKTEQSLNQSDPRLAFLPEAKRAELQALEDRYVQLERDLYRNCKGVTTPGDRNALEGLHQQKANELKALMTPEEMTEYDIRNSPSAQRLRWDLDSFQPSEAEFRAIYQAQAAENSSAAQEQGNNADKQSQDQLKAALGDDRYAEYQRCKDPNYQSLLRIGERFDLSRAVASEVYDLRAGVEAQRWQVQTNAQLSIEQRQAWLQALRDQTSAAVASLMGEKGFTAYLEHGGWWIQQLAP